MDRDFAIDVLSNIRIGEMPIDVDKKWDLQDAIEIAIQAMRTMPVYHTKMARSDKIRQMTEKELANFLWFLSDGRPGACVVCSYCKDCPFEDGIEPSENICKKGVLEWMRQEEPGCDSSFVWG